MEADYALPHTLNLDVPHLADYFGIWSVHDETFRSLVDRVNGINLHAHIQQARGRMQGSGGDDDRAKPYDMTREGIAMLWISGPTMKRASSLSDATSTVAIRQQLRAARKDPDVRGAMIVMDTPGGTVKGNRDLADEVAAFATVKPVYAYTEDMTASAGVSVASQATRRFANNATAMYGAMGTYSVLVDQSAAAEKLGVKVHVIRAGEFKGMGEPGTEITESQLAEAQRVVNRLNDAYLETIARGLKRSVDSIRPLADGRIHMAADALEMGLIDQIATFDEAYAQLLSATKQTSQTNKSPNRSPAMSQDNTTQAQPQAASLAELKSTFPGSTAEWRETQMEANATISQAAINYAQFVEARSAQEREQHAKDLAAAEARGKQSSGSLGHHPITMRDEEEDQLELGEPIEDFNAAVARVAGPNATLQRRQAAIRNVANQRPELYQAYLLACNPSSRLQRLIKEKLETVVAK